MSPSESNQSRPIPNRPTADPPRKLIWYSKIHNKNTYQRVKGYFTHLWLPWWLWRSSESCESFPTADATGRNVPHRSPGGRYTYKIPYRNINMQELWLHPRPLFIYCLHIAGNQFATLPNTYILMFSLIFVLSNRRID